MWWHFYKSLRSKTKQENGVPGFESRKVNGQEATFDIYEVSGHRFRIFKEEFSPKWKRAAMLQLSLLNNERGIRLVDLKKLVQIIKESANAADLYNVVKATSLLEDFVELDITSALTFDIANAVILCEGEDIVEPSPEDTAFKKDLFETDENVRAFFLSLVLSLRTDSPENMASNFRERLRFLDEPVVKETEKRFFTMISTQHTTEGKTT